MTLINFLKKQSSESGPAIPAVVDVTSGDSITYDELWTRVDTCAAKFIGFGIRPGDRIMLALPNSIDWIVYCLAIIQAGAAFVPIKTTSMPWEMKKLIIQTKPAMLIGDAGFINKSLPFDVGSQGQRLAIASRYHLRRQGSGSRVIDLRGQFDRTFDIPSHRHRGEDELVSITHTYRGIGHPLGVMMNHKNYVDGIKAYIKAGELARNHHFLSILPFSYSYPFVGCILIPLATASTIHISNVVTKKQLTGLLDDVDVLTGTPSLYVNMSTAVRHKKLPNVKYAFCGGSFMPEQLFARCKDALGIDIRQGYGLTECLPVTCNPSRGNRPETLGRPLVGMTVSIVDDEGNELPVGKQGEIALRGSSVMRGYWKNAEATQDVFKNQRLLTGDLGHKDGDGYLYFDGLKKRIIKVGGNMVDLAEVENKIASMKDIQFVKGYGVSDDRWGDVVGVDVKFANNGCNEKILKNRLRRFMSSYKVPRIVRQVN